MLTSSGGAGRPQLLRALCSATALNGQAARQAAAAADPVPHQQATASQRGPPRSLLLPLAAAVAVGAAAGALCSAGSAWPASEAQVADLERVSPAEAVKAQRAAWVARLAAEAGATQLLTSTQLGQHTALGGEHLFTSFLEKGLLEDVTCFYDAQRRRFYYVLQLGRGCAGYPRILHGGFTAAVLDETLGFLFYSLRAHGQLPFLTPAFTAQLDVTYKRRVEARPGRTLLCTAEVVAMEGRKLRMRAALSDGPPTSGAGPPGDGHDPPKGGSKGPVYASAEALFVAPRKTKLLRDAAQYLVSGWRWWT